MARVEKEFFAEDSKFEELELAENDLIDAYVRQELTAEDKRLFEARLSKSARLIERVNFARVLAERVAQPSPHPPKVVQPGFDSSKSEPEKMPWWKRWFGFQSNSQLAFAACAVIILVAGIVLVSGWLRLRSESERLADERGALQRQKEELDRRSAEQRTTTEQLTAELQRERDQRTEDLRLIEELQRSTNLRETQDRRPAVNTFSTVFLTPGLLRSGGRQSTLIVGPETTTARVQLALESDDYVTYSTQIKTAEASVVFRKDGLKSHNTGKGPQLLLSLPSRRLVPGDYIVHVDGITASGAVESVGDYAFRVAKNSN